MGESQVTASIRIWREASTASTLPATIKIVDFVLRNDEVRQRGAAVRMVKKKATTQIFLILGGIGATVHAASLRWSAFSRDPTAAWPSCFVVVMNVTLVVLGAMFYALFLRWPVKQLVRNRRISVGLVLLGGLLGMFATFAALQGRYLTGAFCLTYQVKIGVAESSLRSDFLLAIMEIGTYGLIEVFYFLVPAFLCGTLVTATVSRSFFTKAFRHSNGCA